MDLPFVPDDSSTGAWECSEMRAAISREAASMPGLLAGTCHRRPDFFMDRPEISRTVFDGRRRIDKGCILLGPPGQDLLAEPRPRYRDRHQRWGSLSRAGVCTTRRAMLLSLRPLAALGMQSSLLNYQPPMTAVRRDGRDLVPVLPHADGNVARAGFVEKHGECLTAVQLAENESRLHGSFLRPLPVLRTAAWTGNVRQSCRRRLQSLCRGTPGERPGGPRRPRWPPC